jgi:hypothetical protein
MSKKISMHDKSKMIWEYCEKFGHSIDKFLYNPDKPNHQLQPNVLHGLLVSKNSDTDVIDVAINK